MIDDLSISVWASGELEQKGREALWHARGPQESQAQESAPKPWEGAVDFLWPWQESRASAWSGRFTVRLSQVGPTWQKWEVDIV